MTIHKDQYSMATINRRLSSIAAAHRMADYVSDTRFREIAPVMDGLKRTKTVQQRQVKALITPLLKQAIDAAQETLTNQRDRVLILLGMRALRRSEIASLNVSDLTYLPEGRRIVMQRSRGSQFGEGQVIAIGRTNSNFCPVADLQAYLERAGITEGRVFRAFDRHGNGGQHVGPERGLDH
jgi:hypothetical protein